ncbi:hypothetical protein [Belliella aquatica]|uniref:Uncharacterized protein n=1 Tax=Belliella aquatica TaxID=1323734 RepID=A0ABQ1M635_9BACT|nr:hypothetical protein [Belliella aquatica]MCH7404635.1 hypothetical protein [Belliella aquatica]GGC35328.1 hypothetical protein GCM10010993_12810 [Belliella aquatica]
MRIESISNPLKEKEVYVGLADMNIVALNPNIDECLRLGIPSKNAVESFITLMDNGRKKLQLSFFLEQTRPAGRKIKAILNLFLINKYLEREVDKANALIDAYGKIFYEDLHSVKNFLVEPPKYFKFDKSENTFIRQAIIGEPELVSLIRGLLDPQKENISYFEQEDLVKFFEGDITELKNFIENCKPSKIRVLLGSRFDSHKNQKQIVYNKYFAKPIGDSKSYFQKSLEDNKEWIIKQNQFYGNNQDFDLNKIVACKVKN